MTKHSFLNHETLEHRHSSRDKEVASNLLADAYDFCRKSGQATSVVTGGMLEGAAKDAQLELKNPKHLEELAWDGVKGGVTGKLVGLGARLHPLIGLGAAGMTAYTFQRDTIPLLEKRLPELQNYWEGAYHANDPRTLESIKADVSQDFGHTALKLGINGGMALVGLRCGAKAGDYAKPRIQQLMKFSCENLRETSGKWQLKAIYADQILKNKPRGAKVSHLESGTYFDFADKSYLVHHKDGSKFHLSRNGIATTYRTDGSKVSEIPGIMRVETSPKGDITFKYHADGYLETHKTNGSIVKEFPTGVRETHKPNGDFFREVPHQPIELFRKQS